MKPSERIRKLSEGYTTPDARCFNPCDVRAIVDYLDEQVAQQVTAEMTLPAVDVLVTERRVLTLAGDDVFTQQEAIPEKVELDPMSKLLGFKEPGFVMSTIDDAATGQLEPGRYRMTIRFEHVEAPRHFEERHGFDGFPDTETDALPDPEAAGFILPTLARSEGFELVPHPDPEQHPDALGERVPAARAQLLTGNRIAVPDFAIDHAYAVAHEIAEARCGHEHTVEVFSEQANILARWCKTIANTRV